MFGQNKLNIMKRYIFIIALAAASLFSCRPQPKPDPVAGLREHIRLMAEANTSAKRNSLKTWAADSLDLTLLDDPALREQFVGGWIALYRGSSGEEFPEKVAAAAKRLISRSQTEAPQQTASIVRSIAEQLVASNDIGAAASIAAYPYGIDIAAGTYSEIAERLLGATLLPGKRAPAIEGAGPVPSPPPAATLLLFYETKCHSCESIIDELIGAYETLSAMNVRVITVSSDTDPQIFESGAARMPWTDRLCDFKSFAGPNFRRWRVASTPVMWLIDSKGIVTGQFGSLAETGLLD